MAFARWVTFVSTSYRLAEASGRGPRSLNPDPEHAVLAWNQRMGQLTGRGEGLIPLAAITVSTYVAEIDTAGDRAHDAH
jgi:hypothetical protein